MTIYRKNLMPKKLFLEKTKSFYIYLKSILKHYTIFFAAIF